MTLTDVLLRIRALLFRARADSDLDDEVEFHLAMSQEQYIAAGQSPSEAARLARLDFGRIVAVKEDCRTVRGTHLFETIVQDVRYAARSYRRSPGFVLTVAGTIALGLGLNLGLFTLFNAYVLRPVSVRDPYGLYSFSWTDRSSRWHAFTWDEFRNLQKDHPAFSELAAVEYLSTRANGRAFQGQLVSGNYFQMLGVGAALGRTLMPDDAAVPGSDAVMVISSRVWQSMFAGRPDIIGTKIVIHGQPMQVIGVAPPEFQALGEEPRDFWAPLTMAAQLEDGTDLFGKERPARLRVIGRIEQGKSVRYAEAMLAEWSRRMTSQLPENRKATGIRLQSKATAIPLTPELLAIFSPLSAAFSLVLLLACTNVANMMLARAIARRREIGVRLSLGAGRKRLMRQLLTESILLSIPSAILAFVVSRFAIRGAVRLMFATIPADALEMLHDVNVNPPVDWRVAVFAVCTALLCSLLFGLAPAIQATRANLVAASRGEFVSDVRPVRVRGGLVIIQITVCTLLLVVCGALIRTTLRMSGRDIGFRTDGVIAMSVMQSERGRVLAALASDPAVDGLAAASSIPLGGLVPAVTATTQSGSSIRTSYNRVSPNYFEMLGISVIRGRNFTTEEGASGAPVAMVSAAAAQRLFPHENVLGQTIHVAEKPERDVHVVGVVADIATCCIHYGKDAALLYLPARASATGSVLLRVRGDVEVEKRRLDVRLAAVAPGAVIELHSLDQYRAYGIYPFRMASMIGIAIGGLALLLTLSGIYGVVCFVVTQRTKEFGVRVALGATAGSITRLVLTQSLRLAAIGVSLGVALALGLSRALASAMVFMQVFDAAAFSAGVLVVVLTALAAGYMPSRRAATVDPLDSLRFD